MDLQITKKQKLFIDSDANEVLFGGAAGGGKSYGQLVDALLFALKYQGSNQLILRRTYPELERSLILTHLALYPKEIYSYNSSAHRGTFANGSTIEFGYCDNEKDVFKYQSAQYDVIRFDELTHFTESMYVYLISRVRGANKFPKQVKSSTNPGGVGHSWVKARFIDAAPPQTLIEDKGTTRIFIPAKVQENTFLMENDPDYLKRLEQLDEANKKALLYGEWDIFEGQYFSDWDRELHVIKPFELEKTWDRYIAFDYGLDMLACYWIAMDTSGRAYVYRELYQSGLKVSEAAEAIKAMTPKDEKIYLRIAPPDLWNRRNDTGRSAADIFAENGLPLYKAQNDRIQGWYDLAEWLRPCMDEFGNRSANLRIFENCTNLIRCLPSLIRDQRNPNDCAKEPHEITHAPDALRYFCAGRPAGTYVPPERDEDYVTYDDQWSNILSYGR